MSNVAGTQDISPAVLNTPTQKLSFDEQRGFLSYKTYLNLPPRYQQAARDLEKRGQLVIEVKNEY